MFADVIRQAKNEHEICFLLTSYVESVRYCDQLNLLPECVKRVPPAGMEQVREQCQQLVLELDKSSKGLNDNACVVIKEALHIFSVALDRLQLLTVANRPPSAERRKRERRQYSAEITSRPFGAGAQGETRSEPSEDHGQPARL